MAEARNAEAASRTNRGAPKRVILVGWSSDGGGAAVATQKIYRALREGSTEHRTDYEISLRTVRGSEVVDNGHRIGVARTGRINYFLQRYRWLFRRGPRHFLLRQPSFLHTTADIDTGLGREIIGLQPDLLHLFWLGNRTLSIREIGKIQKAGIPIVWTMSDCWPVSGIYHYPPIDESGQNPAYLVEKSLWSRLSERFWNLRILRSKKRHWILPITLVVKSSWLRNQVRSSTLARRWPTVLIPNPIELVERNESEHRSKRRVSRAPVVSLGFGFLGTAKLRKGTHVIESALGPISQFVHDTRADASFDLILFGDAMLPEETINDQSFRIRQKGRLSQEEMMDLYAEVDVLLAPSLQDNSPNVVSEAVAAGIPVVAFRGAGLDEIVVDGVTGLLVEKGDVLAFSQAAARLVVDAGLRETLSETASGYAARTWSPQIVAEQYFTLYSSILSKESP